MRTKALLLTLALLAASAAHATLGGDAQSARDNAAKLNAIVHEVTGSTYRSVVIETPAGTHIRQYLDAQGQVFAITWVGPAMPDLALLLGAHFEALRAKTEQPGPPRSQLNLRTEELVVESAGRMRAFRGRAYLPGKLPAGVAAPALP